MGTETLQTEIDSHLLCFDADWPVIFNCTLKFIAYVADNSSSARIWKDTGRIGFPSGCPFLRLSFLRLFAFQAVLFRGNFTILYSSEFSFVRFSLSSIAAISHEYCAYTRLSIADRPLRTRCGLDRVSALICSLDKVGVPICFLFRGSRRHHAESAFVCTMSEEVGTGNACYDGIFKESGSYQSSTRELSELNLVGFP